MSTIVSYRTEQAGRDVRTLTEATTLETTDSGKVLILGAAAGGAIILPPPTPGWNCRIYTGIALTGAWTVVGDGNIQGSANVNSVSVLAEDETTITFVETAESIGDYIELDCDGTNYFVRGFGALAGAITFS